MNIGKGIIKMKCRNCNSENTIISYEINISVPSKYFHNLSKKAFRDKDVKINWMNKDFNVYCRNCTYVYDTEFEQEYPKFNFIRIEKNEKLIDIRYIKRNDSYDSFLTELENTLKSIIKKEECFSCYTIILNKFDNFVESNKNLNKKSFIFKYFDKEYKITPYYDFEKVKETV